MNSRLLVILWLLLSTTSICLGVGIVALVVLPDDVLALALPLPTPYAQPIVLQEATAPPDAKPNWMVTPAATAEAFTPAPTETPAPSPTTTPRATAVAALPTTTKLPSATATRTATPTPPNLASELLKPLIAEAQRRRAERAAREPQAYARRVDKALNQNRINFLLFGYGTTYEPPLPPGYKGSIAIYSLDLRSLQISTVTLNHDIRAPEVERYSQSAGGGSAPTKLHFAYPTGGFDLMRLAVEDATGLSVDFQVVFQDALVKDVVDELLGGLVVDMPFAFDAAPIYFEDVKYPPLRYPKGRQQLNGIQALQLIKAINAPSMQYDPSKELAVRKQIVVQAALESVKQEAPNPLFWVKALGFLKSTLERKEVEYDFDAGTLVFNTMAQYATSAHQGEPLRLSLGRSIYVVDRGIGDGGVQWVMGSPNPIMQRDLRNGVYVDKAMSVPLGNADPYAADLATKYWPSVRQLVRQRLR